MSNIPTIEDFLFLATYAAQKTELDKAKEISVQLNSSIEWLKYEAGKQTDHQKKNDILMEAEVAKKELDRINRQIAKAENNE